MDIRNWIIDFYNWIIESWIYPYICVIMDIHDSIIEAHILVMDYPWLHILWISIIRHDCGYIMNWIMNIHAKVESWISIFELWIFIIELWIALTVQCIELIASLTTFTHNSHAYPWLIVVNFGFPSLLTLEHNSVTNIHNWIMDTPIELWISIIEYIFQYP